MAFQEQAERLQDIRLVIGDQDSPRNCLGTASDFDRHGSHWVRLPCCANCKSCLGASRIWAGGIPAARDYNTLIWNELGAILRYVRLSSAQLREWLSRIRTVEVLRPWQALIRI